MGATIATNQGRGAEGGQKQKKSRQKQGKKNKNRHRKFYVSMAEKPNLTHFGLGKRMNLADPTKIQKPEMSILLRKMYKQWQGTKGSRKESREIRRVG